jgi:hypothetical protein
MTRDHTMVAKTRMVRLPSCLRSTLIWMPSALGVLSLEVAVAVVWLYWVWESDRFSVRVSHVPHIDTPLYRDIIMECCPDL